MRKLFPEFTANIIFYISMAATVGSLFFGTEYTPCALCWYQRIFMYPIAIITGLSMFHKEKEIAPKYIWAFAIPGFVIGLYHYLLQMKIVGNIVVCGKNAADASCEAIDWSFGQILNIPVLEGITIPFLSMSAFALILVVLFLHRRYSRV